MTEALVSGDVFAFRYLHDLDECFQLVHVELKVQSVCQPHTQSLGGAGVPLLQMTKTPTQRNRETYLGRENGKTILQTVGREHPSQLTDLLPVSTSIHLYFHICAHTLFLHKIVNNISGTLTLSLTSTKSC